MEYAIEMLNITKEFPGIKANDDITLQVKKGEVHALLGENGAGKSTLMSILFGLYQPDMGEIKINGQSVKINDPNDANKYNIGMVHQHFKLVHNFTVLENIILGVEEKGLFGKLKTDNARKKVMSLSEKYHLNIDPDAKIEDITVGMQQRVEILKMLYRNNDILIFDEPTAVLTPQEIDELMKIMKELIKEGKSIIFITHKLNEIKAVADRCTIIRKGRYVGTVNVADVTKEQLSEMMVGHKVNLTVTKDDHEPSDVVLKVDHLSYQPKTSDKLLLNDVSFEVRKGEIVCIAGIDGNGQSELVEAITGLRKVESGRIVIKGEDMTNKRPRKITELGVGHVPEDRHRDGMVLDMTIAENIVLQTYYKEPFSKNGFLNYKNINEHARKLMSEFDVRAANELVSAGSLSGGNQQKAVIAREIDLNPDLLVVSQPTRGLDVGAIEYIRKRLIAERDKGKAVLVISFELDEILDVSDRIAVIHDGKIQGMLDASQTNKQELGILMAGGHVTKEEANV